MTKKFNAADYINISLPGVAPFKLHRGDATDEQWETIKAKAQQGPKGLDELRDMGNGLSVDERVEIKDKLAEHKEKVAEAEKPSAMEQVGSALKDSATNMLNASPLPIPAAMEGASKLGQAVNSPAGKDFLNTVSTGVADLTKGAAPDALKNALAESAPSGPATREAQPVQPNIPPVVPAPPAQTPGASASLVMGVPGSGGAYKNIREAEKASDAMSSAAQDIGKFESERLKQEADAREAQLGRIDKLEKLAMQRAEAQARSSDKIISAQTALAEQQRTLRPDIDPNRYWANKTTGQKVAHFIAAAFLGGAGKGQEYLSSVDGLVRADIQDQWRDYQARREGLDKAGESYQNAFETLKNQGVSDRAAFSILESTGKERIAQQLESIAARSGSEAARARALMTAAQLREKAQLDIAQAKTSQQNADANSMMMKFKMEQEGKNKTDLPATLEKEYANAQSALNEAQAIRKLIDSQGTSGFDRTWNSLVADFPVLGKITGANRANLAIKAMTRSGIRKMEGSALQKHDMEAYEDAIPTTGLIGSKQLGAVEAFEAAAKATMQGIEEYKRTGVAPKAWDPNFGGAGVTTADPRIKR